MKLFVHLALPPQFCFCCLRNDRAYVLLCRDTVLYPKYLLWWPYLSFAELKWKKKKHLISQNALNNLKNESELLPYHGINCCAWSYWVCVGFSFLMSASGVILAPWGILPCPQILTQKVRIHLFMIHEVFMKAIIHLFQLYVDISGTPGQPKLYNPTVHDLMAMESNLC